MFVFRLGSSLFFVSLLNCIFAFSGRIYLFLSQRILCLQLITEKEVPFHFPEFSRKIQKQIKSVFSWFYSAQVPRFCKRVFFPQKAQGCYFGEIQLFELLFSGPIRSAYTSLELFKSGLCLLSIHYFLCEIQRSFVQRKFTLYRISYSLVAISLGAKLS